MRRPAYRHYLRCIVLVSGLALFMSAAPAADAPPSETLVKQKVQELIEALDAMDEWSYDAQVTQRVFSGTKQESVTLARCLYARHGGRSAAVQLDWRDGTARPLPSPDQVRRGEGFSPTTFFTHYFADANQLFSYQAYQAAPVAGGDSQPAPERAVSLFHEASSQLVRRNTDIPSMWSRPLLGYASSTTENFLDLMASAHPLSVQEATEPLDGADCVVVNFVAAQGALTVWLDPDLRWQPRQVVLKRGPTDQFAGRLLWEIFDDREARRTETYKWSDFKLVRGVYMPSRYSLVAVTQLRQRTGRREVEEATSRLSEGAMVAAFDVWTTADIPDGTSAAVFSSKDIVAEPAQYVWRSSPTPQLVGSGRSHDISAVLQTEAPRPAIRTVVWGITLSAMICAIAATVAAVFWRHRRR